MYIEYFTHSSIRVVSTVTVKRPSTLLERVNESAQIDVDTVYSTFDYCHMRQITLLEVLPGTYV